LFNSGDFIKKTPLLLERLLAGTDPMVVDSSKSINHIPEISSAMDESVISTFDETLETSVVTKGRKKREPKTPTRSMPDRRMTTRSASKKHIEESIIMEQSIMEESIVEDIPTVKRRSNRRRTTPSTSANEEPATSTSTKSTPVKIKEKNTPKHSPSRRRTTNVVVEPVLQMPPVIAEASEEGLATSTSTRKTPVRKTPVKTKTTPKRSPSRRRTTDAVVEPILKMPPLLEEITEDGSMTKVSSKTENIENLTVRQTRRRSTARTVDTPRQSSEQVLPVSARKIKEAKKR